MKNVFKKIRLAILKDTKYEILHIKYKLVIAIFLLVIVSNNVLAQEGRNITIDLSFTEQKSIVFQKVYFSDQEMTKFSDFPTSYLIQVISQENRILFEKYLPTEIFNQDTSQIKITLPIFYTGSAINFFYKKQKLFSIDLINNFCKSGDRICHKYCALKGVDSDCFFCGNGVCEKNETKINCPNDCSSLKKSLPSNNLILPENISVESDEIMQDEKQNDFIKKSPGLVFYISFVTGVLLIYFLFWKKRT